MMKTTQDALNEAARKARHANHQKRGEVGEPIGTSEVQMRATASQDGCTRLCDAIEDLVVRTSQRLDIPDEFKRKPLSFARAYLGMRV